MISAQASLGFGIVNARTMMEACPSTISFSFAGSFLSLSRKANRAREGTHRQSARANRFPEATKFLQESHFEESIGRVSPRVRILSFRLRIAIIRRHRPLGPTVWGHRRKWGVVPRPSVPMFSSFSSDEKTLGLPVMLTKRFGLPDHSNWLRNQHAARFGFLKRILESGFSRKAPS